MDNLKPNVSNRGSPETSCSSKNFIISNNNTNINTNTTAVTANKEQDRFLPIANVGRIMKKVIPGSGKISKEAKETVQECVSEFISFVTGEASDKCQREKRKTINGDDIIWAITTLGFEDYVNPLKQYLTKYRELEGDQKLHPPKQQQQQQHLQQQQNDHQNMSTYTTSSVYSSSPSLMSHPPFVPREQHQPFPMPPHNLLPSSIQKQFQQQQEHNIDSVGHW